MTQIKSDPRVHNRNKPAVELVRARGSKGAFIADDPTTPENEAWVEKAAKPKAKPKAKK
tara:strand:- start:298 stop:474 length:177 start_codon:yes stop_codon:yes gene_type:complete